MTNETKSRIHAYTEALPHMKEKVFAALLMLVVAACIVVTATYAWITLSRAPEVSNITTTLSANGALEIALAKPDGSQPDEFDIDENAAIGTNLTESNLQWGNLVNLSDKSYGIDNIALRPAKLNTGDLLNDPMEGAVYGEDGRIAMVKANYTYAKYDERVDGFTASDDRGVRAITTYTVKTSDATFMENQMLIDAISTARGIVDERYQEVIGSFVNLAPVITRKAQDSVNSSGYGGSSDTETNSDYTSYLPAVREYYGVLKAAMDAQKDVYVALANLQYYQWCKNNSQDYAALSSWDDVDKAYNDGSSWLSITELGTFINDYNLLVDDMAHLEKYIETDGVAYYWSSGGDSKYNLSDMINRLINYGTMSFIIDGKEYTLGTISGAATYLLFHNGSTYPAYVKDSILQRFEQRALDSGSRMNGNAQCRIVLDTVAGEITVNGKVYTSAEGEAWFSEDYRNAKGNVISAADKAPEDTCGFAVDLWVRSNAEQTYLILEGAVVSDPAGGDYQYQGENRIWGEIDGINLTTNSTTQGGGSCYTYYADTPEDMMRSLELLSAMKVAFAENIFDSEGKVYKISLLATAEMDTENYLAVNGCVTVPLVVNETTTPYTYVDETNAVRTGHAIADLKADRPVCITAYVYLDGNQLTNDDVLAAGQIEGSLNIQFGSSADLDTMGDSELKDDERFVTATVSPNELNYDEAKVDIDLTTTVTVQIKDEGRDEVPAPTSVTAFFVRAINATQGSREEPMEFRALPDGTWVSEHVFTAPGTYYLRQVCVDGVNYTLDVPQKVEVYGYGQNNNVSVSWSESSTNVTIRTADDSHTTKVTAKFSDVKKPPASVQARFVRDDGNTVSVPLTKNSNGDWVGTTTFTVSGVYTLQYLVADGHYIDIALDDGSYRTLNLSLGMYVTVDWVRGALREDFVDGETYPRTVKVTVFNNAGDPVKVLKPGEEQKSANEQKHEEMILYYSNGGSESGTVDANLTWDNITGAYLGTLRFTEAGQFRFAYVELGSNRLSEYRGDPPVFVLRSDKPVIYNTDSACTPYEETGGIQYAPVTRDATIDGICIKNATSGVSGKVVVYSEEANEFFTVDLEYNGSYSEDDKVAGGTFYVKLPTYSEQTGTDSEGKPVYKQLQDGTWTVVAISLWNCFDENGIERGADDPLVWVDSDTLGDQYLGTPKAPAKPDRRYRHDFSALTTTVSAEIKITMTHKDAMSEDGTIALGSHDDPFGTIFHIADIGMSVTVVDGNDDPIPKGFDITMTVSYSGNENVKNEDGTVRIDNAKTYGYEVDDAAFTTYTIKLDVLDKETGTYTVAAVDQPDADDYWKYVGVYKVESLAVNLKVGEDGEGKPIYEAYKETIPGVPAQYTVTTKAAEADSIKVIKDTEENTNNASLGNTVFGLDTGLFLNKYDLNNTFVTVSVVSSVNEDVSMEHAVIGNLNIEMILKYQGGSEEKGGYTIAGETGYETLTLTMVKSGTAYVGPKAQTMLAGEYEPTQLNVTLGTTETWEDADFKELFDEAERDKVFVVYSKKPDVKITGVSTMIEGKENDPVTVNTNADPNSNYKAATEFFETTNRYDESNGRWAVVYMAYKAGAIGATHEYCGATSNGNLHTNYANYTQPGVRFKMFDGGVGTASIAVDGIGTVELTNNTDSEYVTVGSIAEVEAKNVESHTHLGVFNCDITYTTEAATLLNGGKPVTISTVTSTITDDKGTVLATFTRQLANPITISQPNKQNLKLSWESEEGISITVTDNSGTEYADNTYIPVATELTVTITADFGYYAPIIDEPAGVHDWKEDEDQRTDTKRVYTFRLMDDADLTCSVSKYPTITFSSTDAATVTVTATVDGETEPVTSGVTGVKADAVVEVTVTANRDKGYCLPEIDLSKCVGVTEWISRVEGSFESTYTFEMPDRTELSDATVHLAAPDTAETHAVTWTNTGERTFKVVASDGNVFTDGLINVVPGDTVTITLTAVGGTNPVLTAPDNADEDASGTDINGNEYVIYTYRVNSDLELDGKVDGYPVVKLDNIYASVAVAGKDYPDGAGTGVGIKAGSTVTVTLTAKAGWYAPRMSLPDVVDDLKLVDTPNNRTAIYEFTMPNAAVDATQMFIATGYCVTYDYATNGGSGSPAYADYAGTALKLPTPDDRTGYAFNGWYTAASGGTKVEDDYTPTADITLYAQWTGYTVTYNANGGSCSTTSQTYAGTALKLPTPTRTGYKFNGWCTAASGGTTVEDGYTPTADITLYAQWTGYTVTYNPNSGRCSTTSQTYAGTALSLPTATRTAYDFIGWYTAASGGSKVGDAGASYTPTADITLYAHWESSLCVTPDTLITLADGTQKRVDQLGYEDQILAWNMFSGEYQVTTASYIIRHAESDSRVIELKFDDGSTVKIIGEHGFLDANTGEYVFIDKANIGQHIGHQFVKHDGATYFAVTLESYAIHEERTSSYSVSSIACLNVITDGIVSITPAGGFEDSERFFNFLTVGEGLKYDEDALAKDIETYGLFVYDDLAAYMSLEEFAAFEATNGCYWKIAIGKGFITMEELLGALSHPDVV